MYKVHTNTYFSCLLLCLSSAFWADNSKIVIFIFSGNVGTKLLNILVCQSFEKLAFKGIPSIDFKFRDVNFFESFCVNLTFLNSAFTKLFPTNLCFKFIIVKFSWELCFPMAIFSSENRFDIFFEPKTDLALLPKLAWSEGCQFYLGVHFIKSAKIIFHSIPQKTRNYSNFCHLSNTFRLQSWNNLHNNTHMKYQFCFPNFVSHTTRHDSSKNNIQRENTKIQCNFENRAA